MNKFEPERIYSIRIERYLPPGLTRLKATYKVIGYNQEGNRVHESLETPTTPSDARTTADHLKKLVERYHPCEIKYRAIEAQAQHMAPHEIHMRRRSVNFPKIQRIKRAQRKKGI